MIFKNTFGLTIEYNGELNEYKKQNPFTGSSLNRKRKDSRKLKQQFQANEKQIQSVKETIPEIFHENKIKEKTMSSRTKSKIRRKIIALSQIFKRLSFVTLTFVNKIEDEQAILVLRKFLDNIKKRSKDFQYLWVAEKQTKNETFKDNIHFHLITNKYWDVNKDWKYWLDVQRKNGIVPRDENFKPSSAFDVRGIVSNNIKGLTCYLTKYVTKNGSKLKCQVWNCSKKISSLYTSFYSDNSFLKSFLNQHEIQIKEKQLEYCKLNLIPLNQKTMGLYTALKEKNSETWKNDK